MTQLNTFAFNMSTNNSNTKRTASLLLCVICLLAVVFGGSACTNTPSESDRTQFVGTWQLVSLGEEGENQALSKDDVALYKQWGLTSQLVLSQDGSAVFSFYGDEYAGAWELASQTKGSLALAVTNEGSVQQETYEFSLQEGALTLSLPEMPATFTKVQEAAE